MASNKLNNDEIKKRIVHRLNSGAGLPIKLDNKTLEDLVVEVSIYHEELVYQNEELLRTQNDLEKVKNHYESLFHNSPIGYVIIDSDFKISLYNKKFLSFINVAEDLEPNKKIVEFIHPEYQDKFYFFVKDSFAGKTELSAKITLVGKNQTLPMKIQSELFLEKDKTFVRLAFVDISAEEKYYNELHESEEKFRLITENTKDGIVVLSKDFNVIYTSPAYSKIMGYSSDENQLKTKEIIYELIHPDDRDRIFNNVFLATSSKEEALVYQFRIKHKNGHYIWREDTAKFIYDEKGTFYSAYIVCRDISEKITAQNKLKNSEQRYKELQELFSKIAEIMPDMLWVKDLNKNFIFANNSVCVNLLSAKDTFEPLGKNDLFFGERERLLHPKEPNWYTFDLICQDSDDLILKTGETNRFIESGYVKGKPFYLEVIKTPLKNDEGKIIGIIGLGRDISERIKAEEQLKTSEANYRILAETAPDIILTYLEDGKITYINKAGLEFVGLTDENYKDANLFSFIPSKYYPSLAMKLKERQNGFHEPQNIQIELINSEGKLIPFDVISTPIIVDGKITGFLEIARNVEERKKAEAELRESEEKYRILAETTDEMIMRYDPNGCLTFCNKAALIFTGMTEENYRGKNIKDFIHPNYYSRLAKNLEERAKGYLETRYFEIELINKYGASSPFDVLSSPILHNGVITDYISIARSAKARKESEEALRQSEARYMAMFNYINVGVAVYLPIENSEHFVFIAINKAAERITNLKNEEVIGKHLLKLFPNMINTGFYNALIQVNKTGESIDMPEFFYKDFKREGWRKNFIYKLPSGEIVAIFQDVTERKVAEEKLLKTNERIQALINAIPDKMFLLDKHGTLIDYASAGAHEDLLLPPEQFLGKNILDTVNPELGALTMSNLSKLIETGETQQYYYELVFNDKLRCYESRLVKCGEEEVLSIVRDITEAKKAEDSLRKFYRAVEQSQVSIVITNLDGTIEYVNPRFEKNTGYTREEALGQNPRILKSGYLSEIEYKAMWNDLTEGKVWSGTFLNKKKNGDLFWESSVITPVKDENGNIKNFVAVKEDITASKEMELELRRALDKAEELSSIKSNFLANINHELRTPLNGILGFSQILCEVLDDEEQYSMADAILSSGIRLNQTLSMIIDLSNLESEKMALTLKEMEISSLIKDISQSYATILKQKNIDFEIIVKQEPVFSPIDKNFFSLIISNLLDNAIKFTPKGKVSIELSVNDNNPNKPEILIKIIDTGIGIAPDKLSVIWEAFRQASEGLNRSFEGSGLGLTVAKRMISLMNGTISVESELEIGSTFTISLPVISKSLVDENKVIQKENQKTSKLLRVLYIEDDLINQDLIKMFLRNNYLCDTADNAFDALEKIQQLNYDIILMDINLGPGMNGAQAAKEIRKNEAYKNTPIVAITAYTGESDKELFFELGCSHYLAKPFMKSDLMDLLDTVFVN